jgi:hypothetical protein
VLDPYCLKACPLPLRLLKDEVEVAITDESHPTCGSCGQPPLSVCPPEGTPVHVATYSLPQRYVVAGKCGAADCAAPACLDPGHYKVVLSIYTKQPDGSCGGSPIELSYPFDYPKTTEVVIWFSTLKSCAKNSECSTGLSCFRDNLSSQCYPTGQLCSSRDPEYNRCLCPSCICDLVSGEYWACVK